MEVEAAFPSHGEAFGLVQEGEGLLDDVAELARAVDVGGTALGDDGQDAAVSKCPADGLAVVALVAEQGVRSLAGVADPAGDWRDGVDQVQGLGDVVDVGRGGDDLERGAVAVADQVVLAAALAAVDRRRARRGPPLPSSWPRDGAPGLRPRHDLEPQPIMIEKVVSPGAEGIGRPLISASVCQAAAASWLRWSRFMIR